MTIDEAMFDLFVIIVIFDENGAESVCDSAPAENRLLSHYVRYLLLYDAPEGRYDIHFVDFDLCFAWRTLA